LAKAGAGAVDEGSDGGGRFVEYGCDRVGVEVVDGGEKQGGALGFGESVDGGEGGLQGVVLGELLVDGQVARDEGFDETCFELTGRFAAFAVEGEVPGDADEPDAEVFDGVERVLMLQYAHEGVLHGVFSFGAVTQDPVGDAEEQGGVGVHERGEVD